jgi:hypothetical protein
VHTIEQTEKHLELRGNFADGSQQAAGAEHWVALSLRQLADLGSLSLRQLFLACTNSLPLKTNGTAG